MIHYIKRKELDIVKYDACIENSLQFRMYAFSWYLDIVADHWDVLILDDYNAVMPITWKQKYCLKYITQPYFCQQLGIFSKDKLLPALQEELVKSIPKKFIKVSLNYNSDNFFASNMTQKKNFMLFLNDSYTALFKSFSKGRKHAVKVGKKKGLVLRETSVKSLIEIQEKFYDYTSYSKEKLKILSHYILEHHKGEILGVFKDEVLVGGAFFLYSKKRITYLFSSFSDDGKKLQAASFLINNMIEKHQNSDLILDFEGGNMPNIGSFYKSFGADIELYNLLQKNNVIGMLKVFKK